MAKMEIFGREVEIDDNMETLVWALNKIPGVYTESCCGGRKDPKDGQSAEGDFTVSLRIDQMRRGWRAIAIISQAIWEPNCLPVELTSWPNPVGNDGDFALSWSLDGCGVEPKVLAERIDQLTRATLMETPGPAPLYLFREEE